MTRMQSVVRWIGVAVVLGMLGLPALRPAQGQTLRWSEPVPLSRSGKFAWFPEIVSDRSGKVHVVWAEGYLGFDAVFYTSSINGTDWSAPIDIQAVQLNEYGPSAVRPSITIAQDSEMHLTYFTDSSGVLHTRAPVWNAGVVQAWAEPVKVNGIQAGYFSRIVEDQAGILHMFFTENVPTTTCQICFHVFYRQSQDNGDTWSERVDVSVEDIGSAKPNPLVDKDGNLHVVWESGFGGGQGQLSDPTSVMVASSYDGGLTWSDPYSLNRADDPNTKNVIIGQDARGNLVVAYWSISDNLVYYTISKDDGKTWSDSLPIPGVIGAAAVYKSNLDDYAMAADGDGNLHLIIVGQETAVQSTLDVLDVVWDGVAWQAPSVVAAYEGDVPEWPRVTVSRGNIVNVVWFVRAEETIWDSDNGKYRVWYARGVTSAARVNPEAIPTFTPTVEPTALPTQVLTPQVDAVMNANDLDTAPVSNVRPQSGDVLYSETDYVLFLAKSLIPSVIFLAGVFMVNFIRRK